MELNLSLNICLHIWLTIQDPLNQLTSNASVTMAYTHIAIKEYRPTCYL